MLTSRFFRARRISPSRAGAALLLTALALACGGDASSPPVPTEVRVLSGDGQQATVGTALPAPVTVWVTDEEGGGVPGVVVSWSVPTGGGDFSPASTETGSDGRASATWTLGTAAGEVAATVSVSGVPPATVRATAVGGAPEEMVALSGDGQHAEAGEPLPEPLSVRVEDHWGNPVAGAQVEWAAGAGTLQGANDITGADGVASATWSMGREAGAAEATARVAGGSVGEVHFSAVADPTTLDLTVANAYLVQGVQRWNGDVPLVAGRDGLLRVFVEASRATGQRPDVRVTLRDAGGAVLVDQILAPSPDFVPGPGVSESSPGSYNLKMQGRWVAPGLRVEVKVDPEDEIGETDEGDNDFPGGGAVMSPVVEEVAPFKVTFVPILVNGAVGAIDNPELMLWYVESMYPLDEIDGDVRGEPLDLSEYDLRQSEDFPPIVASVLAARVADGSQRYYYGVLPSVENAAWSGWGMVGGPAAVGVETESLLVAHELGHTWGRRHPPCGTAEGVDEDYPYADAATGIYGFDIKNSSIPLPDRTDIMAYTYCGDRFWISDYTYEGVLAFRAAEAEAATLASRQPTESLIVWGRAEGDSLVLEPAFRAVVPPSLPAEAGPYRLQGVDDTGASVFDLSFRPTPVADVGDGAAVFAFAVPVDPGRALAALRLGDGVRTTEIRAPAAATPSAVAVERLPGERVRLRWDPAHNPLVVVRDAANGHVVAFARGGDAVLHAPMGRALELVPSTGVDGRIAEPIRR